MDNRLHQTTQTLRVAIGLMATLAGLDKFFNLLADWGSYVSPAAASLLPFPADVFMGIVGVIEFAVGVAILTALPVAGAYVAAGWLTLVAGNLLLGGYIDVAVRDLVLAIAAFTLARLLEERDVATAAAPTPAGTPRERYATER